MRSDLPAGVTLSMIDGDDGDEVCEQCDALLCEDNYPREVDLIVESLGGDADQILCRADPEWHLSGNKKTLRRTVTGCQECHEEIAANSAIVLLNFVATAKLPKFWQRACTINWYQSERGRRPSVRSSQDNARGDA